MLHCNGVFWSHPSGMLWITSNFIETAFFWAVPVFFMIIGAVQIDYRKKYSTREYLHRRFTKTGIPFIFWSIVSYILYLVRGGEQESIRQIISGIFLTRYISIYWFFIPLFAVYLSVPLLSAVSEELRIRVFTYLSICAFALVSVMPTVCLLIGIDYNGAIQPAVTGGYALYVLLGYLVSHVDYSKQTRCIIYGLGILGWLLQDVGTTILSDGQEAINGTFKGYLNFPAVMQAFAVMILFRYIRWERLPQFWMRLIQQTASCTFGVYLIHFYIVRGMPYLIGINTSSIWWRTGGAILIFVVCVIIVRILHAIPVLRRLV